MCFQVVLLEFIRSDSSESFFQLDNTKHNLILILALIINNNN